MKAKEIKAIRKALGLTQGEFAERIGVRANTVWRWENGYSRPHPIMGRLIFGLKPPKSSKTK